MPLATLPLQIPETTPLVATDLTDLSLSPTPDISHEMRSTISNSPSFAVAAVPHSRFQTIFGVSGTNENE